MTRTTQIDSQGPIVHDASICELDVSTADTNADGIYLQDGTDRGMACGIGVDGHLYMWITTNGDPILIGNEASVDDCLTMADNGAAASQGRARILDAIAQARRLFLREEAQADLDEVAANLQ